MSSDAAPLIRSSSDAEHVDTKSSLCSSLTIWRATGSNRRLWKCVCTIFLIAEFGYYVFFVLFDSANDQNDFDKFTDGIIDASREENPLTILCRILLSPFASSSVILALLGCISAVKFLTEIWGQDTSNWVCPSGILMFVVVYFGIFVFLIYTFGICRYGQDILNGDGTSVHARNLLGFALFLFGSAYSLTYEVRRFRWKKNPANKGRLHTIELASLCVHPNYFGDLFTYSGWALVSGTSCAFSAPVGMVWGFQYLIMPNSDAYLASRYADEFPDYAANTPTLIPGVRSKVGMHVIAWSCLAVSCWLGLRCTRQCVA